MTNKQIYINLILFFGLVVSCIFNTVYSYDLKESYQVNERLSDHINKSDMEIRSLQHKLEFGW